MDTRIPLMVQPLDIGGSIERGLGQRYAREDGERRNALQAFMQENAPAIMAGDQNALAGLAQFDPQMAFGLQRDRQAMDMDRQRLDLTRRSTEHSMANDDARLAMARQEAAQRAAAHVAQMDEAERLKDHEEAVSLAQTGLVALKNGKWDAWNDAHPEYAGVSEEDAPIALAELLGVADALMPQEPEGPPAEFRNRELQASAGGLEPGTPAYQNYMLNGATQRTEEAPSGYRYTPEGNLEFVPGGPADPKVGANRAVPTEGERKAGGYYERMVKAEEELAKLPPGAQEVGQVDQTLMRQGVGPGYVLTPEQQKAKQWQVDWVRAKIRWESGAVIGDDEAWEEASSYFPRAGDDPSAIAVKGEKRKTAIEQMRIAAGRAGNGQEPAAPELPQPGGPQPDWMLSTSPSTWTEEQKAAAEAYWGVGG